MQGFIDSLAILIPLAIYLFTAWIFVRQHDKESKTRDQRLRDPD